MSAPFQPSEEYLEQNERLFEKYLEAAMPVVVRGSPVKQSFFEQLTQAVYLDYVLKILGIVLFALAMFKGWSQLGLGTKFLLVSGPIAWYVGARFAKIYR